MARKKKKLTGKQLKQQRQAAIERKRRERGWQPPQAHARRQPDEVVEDMLPLFPMLGDPYASSGTGVERLMKVLVGSEDLIEEPEFDEIIVDPMLCADTLVAVGEELGIDPETLSQLPDEEREDAQLNLIETMTRRLLTDELREDILNGLNQLRLRLKQTGQRKKAAKAAALQAFLRDHDTEQVWPMTGLAQAIVQRSLAAGLELLAASAEAAETKPLGEHETPLNLYHKLSQSSLVQKAEGLLKKIPGLRGFLSKQADTILEEGADAVFTGDLYLELFTPEELAAGFDLFKTALAGDTPHETPAGEILAQAVTEEKAKFLISQVDDYITRLFTSERLGQLRTRLNTILNDPDCPKKWVAFILMLAKCMEDEDAVENQKPFLIKSFFGEMRAAAVAQKEVEE